MIKKVLTSVGRPAYLLLSYLFIFILFIFYLIGATTRTSLGKLLQVRRPVKSWPSLRLKIKIHEPPLPRQQLSLPKIRIKIKIPSNAWPGFARKLPHLPKLNFSILGINKSIYLGMLLITAICFSFWFFILRGLPSPQELVTRKQPVSTKIYDRNQTLLYTIYKDQNRTPVALAAVPWNVRLATLAAEDAEFYHHPGFSVRGISRAFFKNIEKGELTGGSTITQQLVKNALLTPQKTFIRKLREIILSVRVEIAFSKDAILEMYLNEVSYGGAAYGIQEAARVYFDKNVDELTLAEAALLAGLPKSPTKFSPFGSQPELAKARQEEVLHLMRQNSYITPEQEAEAKGEELKFAANQTDIKAPHFVMYIKSLLVEKYGEEVMETGGLEVVTSLDYEMQEFAQEIVKKEVDSLAGLNVQNGAAVILNPQTGEILSMVGSKDYFNTQIDGNVNLTLRPRQPGSSIKVVNYAYALSHGFTPATMVKDTPQVFKVPGLPDYTPKNYDGAFRGTITVRDALAQSRNIPAVAILQSYGVEKMLSLGQEMGITTWENPANYGLSLTLGGGEVKLLDLAQVYATVANFGQRPEITPILKVTNYQGKVLEQKIPESQAVLDPRVAYQLIDILKDNNARAPSFGTHSTLVIPNHPEVAVKTGTSNDLKDNLTIGFNQDYLVAVWVGNNNNSPMSRIASGLTGASAIWQKIIQGLLTNKEARAWEPPEKLVQLPICTLTGTLACKDCPTRREWFLEENRPQFACRADSIEAVKKEKAKYQGFILEEAFQTQR